MLASGPTIITVSGAQIAGSVILGAGILLFAKDPYIDYLGKGMSQKQKEYFQREIEDLKKSKVAVEMTI